MLPRGYEGRPFLQVRSELRGLLPAKLRNRPRSGVSEARRYKERTAVVAAGNNLPIARSGRYVIGRC